MEELEKPTGLFKQLPLAIIAQYAILALHGTTCDQIFMLVVSFFGQFDHFGRLTIDAFFLGRSW
jgi:hypothetical protein